MCIHGRYSLETTWYLTRTLLYMQLNYTKTVQKFPAPVSYYLCFSSIIINDSCAMLAGVAGVFIDLRGKIRKRAGNWRNRTTDMHPRT